MCKGGEDGGGQKDGAVGGNGERALVPSGKICCLVHLANSRNALAREEENQRALAISEIS